MCHMGSCKDYGIYTCRPGTTACVESGGCSGKCQDCIAIEECVSWEEGEITCPACLEFDGNGFREIKMLENVDGRYFCPDCGEMYGNGEELATRTIAALKDALDNRAWDMTQAGGRQQEVRMAS